MSFDVAFNWMMDNEDARREYADVPDAGGRAISGINSKAFPHDYERIAATPQSQRGPLVHNFYLAQFWNQFYAAISSDDLCKRVFDAAVNMGPGTAVKILQRAVNTVTKEPIKTDGGWGPATITAVNACDPAQLLAAFKAGRSRHYQAIVAMKPETSKYLRVWLPRAVK